MFLLIPQNFGQISNGVVPLSQIFQAFCSGQIDPYLVNKSCEFSESGGGKRMIEISIVYNVKSTSKVLHNIYIEINVNFIQNF